MVWANGGVRIRTLITSAVALVIASAQITVQASAAAADDKDIGEIRKLAAAYNASGQQLFKELLATSKSIVISPYSVGAAMAMVFSGARGETESEMTRVLQNKLGRADVDMANGKLLSALTRQSDSKLLVANALMLPKTATAISSEYKDGLTRHYGAEIFRNADLGRVNARVLRATDGKIDKIIDKFDGDSQLAVLNAVYFKARWARPFLKNWTRKDPFHLSPSRQIEVLMMRQDGAFALVEKSDYRAILLPYAGGKRGMVIVLPERIGALDSVQAQLGAEQLTELFSALHKASSPSPQNDGPMRVDLKIPRFTIDFKMDLSASFQTLGLKKAFDPRIADFGGMTDDKRVAGQLHLEGIVHATRISVTEDGTEAAATTSVTASITSLPVPFYVDRPFLFYVVDEPTSVILFQGRIVDPRS